MSNVPLVYNDDGDTLSIAKDGVISFGADTAITFTLTGNNIIIVGVPTDDPAVVGALWTNSNVLTISAGA